MMYKFFIIFFFLITCLDAMEENFTTPSSALLIYELNKAGFEHLVRYSEITELGGKEYTVINFADILNKTLETYRSEFPTHNFLDSKEVREKLMIIFAPQHLNSLKKHLATLYVQEKLLKT